MPPNRKGIGVLLPAGAILVSLTIVAFLLLGIDWTGLNAWALAFLVVAEIVCLAVTGALRGEHPRRNEVLLQAGVGTAISMYGLSSVVYALFAGAFKHHGGAYVLIGLVIMAFFALAAIAILSVSKSVEDRAKGDATKVNDHQAERGSF